MEKKISMNEMERPTDMDKGKLNFSISKDQHNDGRRNYIDMHIHIYHVLHVHEKWKRTVQVTYRVTFRQ